MEALQKKVDSPAIEEKVKEVLEEVWVQEEEAFSRTLLKELIEKMNQVINFKKQYQIIQKITLF
jgi:hypothetical protein